MSETLFKKRLLVPSRHQILCPRGNSLMNGLQCYPFRVCLVFFCIYRYACVLVIYFSKFFAKMKLYHGFPFAFFF